MNLRNRYGMLVLRSALVLVILTVWATISPVLPQAGTSVPPVPSKETGQSREGAASAALSGTGENLSASQLEKLVGKIALYPDDLLALVLPASTQAIQVVQAQRFLDQRKSDPKAEPPKTWDPSIVALLNYPEVIALMNSDLTWTEQLGTAVINQQAAVMDAIQDFRRKVASAGNLKSNDKQKVVVQKNPQQPSQGAPPAMEEPANETIVIESASPDVVYVPSYDPATVVAAPAPGVPYPYYYSAPYPYYYSPGAAFFTGAIYGAALGYALSWGNGGIYHGDVNINNNFNRNTRVNNGNIGRNRENAWRADRGRGQGGDRGRSRAGNRPTSQSIRSGLSQRGGQRPGAGAGQRPGAGAGQRPGVGGGQRPTARTGQRAGAGAIGQRPTAGQRPATSVAQRTSSADVGQRQRSGGAFNSGAGGSRNFGNSAFGGAGYGSATNRASFRGNQSMGSSQFTGNRGGGGGFSRGGGGYSRGGGGGRGGGRGGGGGRRR